MLTSPGIGSGLDINSLVSQLVAAEGQSASARLDRQEAAFTAEISAVGSLKAAVSTFKSAVEKLNAVEDFRLRTSSTSDKDVLTSTASDTATPGTYDVEVVRLASAQRIRSGDFASTSAVVGEGTLTIDVGGNSFAIDVDSTNSSLDGIRDAINNATDNVGVSATIINVDDGAGGTVSRLVLSANDTGLANRITVTTADADGNDTDTAGLSRLAYEFGVTENMTELVPAQDALIRIFNQDVTRSTNKIDDAISGVTIDLKSASPGTTETVTVSLNRGAVRARVNEFIAAYNGLMETTKSLGGYNAATETGGALLGDATLRTLTGRVRSEISKGLTGAGLTYRSLADIGITTTETGALELDGTRFDAVLDDDFNAVGNIFAASGGYAERLEGILSPYVDTNGLLDSRITGLNKSVERITSDRTSLALRLEGFEERLRNQFFAMDQIVSQLSATSDFLGQQLENLPGASRSNR